MDKWPACARLSAVAPAGHLPTAPKPPRTHDLETLNLKLRGVAIAHEMGGVLRSDLTCAFTLLSAQEARPLGVQLVGDGDLLVVVTDANRPLGTIRVQVGGHGTVMFFDNRDWSGGFEAQIRVLGGDGLLFFNDIGDRFVALKEIFLRSSNQLLYWGIGASAVGLSVQGCSTLTS
jgi:hypothetical protein